MFTPSQIAAEISTIAGIFEGMVPSLQPLGIDPILLDTIKLSADDLKQVAAAFATADAQSAGSLIGRIQADSNAILVVLASLPLPPEVAMAMMIAQIVLPAVISAAGLLFMPAIPPVAKKP